MLNCPSVRSGCAAGLVVACLIGGFSARHAHAALEGYWSFNEGSGTTVSDASGNGNNGTFATSSWVAGQAGTPGDYALNVVSSSQAVSVPASGFGAIGTNNAVTLSLWVYGDSALQPRNNTTVQGVNGANRIVFTHLPYGTSQVYWDSGNAACCGSDVRLSAAATPSQYEGTWNYWTFVKDGNTDVSSIYVNGSLFATTSNSTANLSGLTALTLAADYRGYVDDVAIYSQAISTNTITAMATGTLANGVTYSDALVGSNGYTKSGAGTTTLNADNKYLGGTTVNGGTLVVASPGSLSSTTTTVNGGTLVLSAADGTGRVVSNDLVLNGATVRGVQDNVGAGGTIDISATNVTHTFTASGSLTVPTAVSASELIVGGGGGGGGGVSGTVYPYGGGGGQVRNLTGQAISAGATAVVVGAGGIGVGNGVATAGTGGSSSIGGNSAAGGGTPNPANTRGGTSGSGLLGGTRSGTAAGGGGGSSAAGSNAPNGTTGGAGGAGTPNSVIVGLVGTYGGGGGGQSVTTQGAGGAGGGGAGTVAGMPNTGGGGGGNASGGSGIAVVQYAYAQSAGTVTLNGNIDVQSNSTLDAYGAGGVLVVGSGAMTGSGGINIASSNSAGGVVRYDSTAKSYTGDTSIAGGATLLVTPSATVGNNSITTVSANGTLVIGANPGGRTLTNDLVLSGGTVRGAQDNVGTGGVIAINGSYVTHTFTASGTLTLPGAVSASELIVGGGAGGGGGVSGTVYSYGGGGGQVLNLSGQALGAGANPVVVGAGGVGVFNGVAPSGNGGASSVGGKTATGGLTPNPAGNRGGTSGSGNLGGTRVGVGAGGGGGGSAAGGNGNNSSGGNGGAGTANSVIVGLSGTYGGGGGGQSSTIQGNGGVGGGGNGTEAGTPNSGGGGGGNANGGSGLVVVQYPYIQSAVTVTLSGNINVQNDSTLDAFGSGGLLIVGSGAMTGSGGITIASSNSAGGVVRYDSTAKAYNGDTTIGGGATLRAGLTNALPYGAGKGNVVLDGGTSAGTLDLNNFDTAMNGLNGATGAVLGQVVNNGSAATKTLTLGNGDANGNFAGIIKDNTSGSGVVALTKNGSGTQILSGANTYTGNTAVNAGTLEVAGAGFLYNAGSAGSATVSVNSGALLRISSSTNNALGYGGETWLVAGAMSVTGGNANTLPGTVTLNGGTLTSTTGNVTYGAYFANAATVTANGAGNTISSVDFGIQGGTALVLSTPLAGDSLSASTAFKDVAGAGALTKTGSGALTLSGVSSYSGTTTIENGTLVFTNGNASATADQALGKNSLVNLGVAGTSSGVLRYTGAGDTLAKDVHVLGNGSDTIQNAGSGLLTLSGTLTKTGTTLTLEGGAAGIEVTGVIQGNTGLPNSDLTVDNGATTLSNANTYNGPTYIRSTVTTGILNTNAVDALPTLNGRSAVVMDDVGLGGSQLNLNGGFNQAIASLSGAASSAVNLNANTLTIGAASGSSTFAGVISGVGGSLVKDSNSTQVLTGSNTFSGTTTVLGGTLQLAAGGLENSDITVSGGAFLQTAGTNHVTGLGPSAGNLTVNGGVFRLNGGTLDFQDYSAGGASAWTPAANRASTISLTTGADFEFTGGTLLDVSQITTTGGAGAFTQNGGDFIIGQGGQGPAALTTINGGYSLVDGALHFDAFGVDPSPETCCDGIAGLNDQLTVTGDVTLDSVVSIDFVGYTPVFGDVFTLICADDIAIGDNFALTGGYFRVVPTGNLTGPQYALQAIVPEPASVALWTVMGLIGTMGAWRWRRRKHGPAGRELLATATSA